MQTGGDALEAQERRIHCRNPGGNPFQSEIDLI